MSLSLTYEFQCPVTLINGKFKWNPILRENLVSYPLTYLILTDEMWLKGRKLV